MSKRYRDFANLNLRQKRRRVAAVVHNIDNNLAHPDSSSSNFDESSEDSVVSAIGLADNNEIQIRTPLGSEDGSIHSDCEQNEYYSDDEETMSSHEEDTDEEIENENLVVENVQEEDEENSEDSEDFENENEYENIVVPENPEDLKKRALKNAFLAANLTHKQGRSLLKTLRELPFDLAFLPKDPRTLLNTSTVVATRYVQQVAGGEYLHIGLKRLLKQKLESLAPNVLPETVDIDLSTDGGRADKGTDQFWPHQVRIANISDKRPMIVGIFLGKHKPTNAFDFYEQMVQEIVEIREQGGIYIGNQQLTLNVRCFIADAPARAFALNHYGHTSSNACSKCKVEGHRCNVPGSERTMVFLGIRHTLRTDEEYRNLVDEDHHKGRSPLSPILGLVTRVPFESMHLVWLGNMKKIVAAKVSGSFAHRNRLNGRKLNILNARLMLLTTYCPSEFNRRPREIDVYHNYKATEFRQLLLYTAPAVFQNVFEDEYWDHLMILNSVMRLLISEDTPREMYPFCQESLESYVTSCEVIYGQQFISYNVHGLLHIVADVEKLGALETFSAFGFENNMPEFSKKIRKPGLKLQQYFKRMCELNDLTVAPICHNVQIRVSQPHAEGPLSEDLPEADYQQFHKLQIGELNVFATTLRDNCCILQNHQICLIKNIVKVQEIIFLIVKKFLTVTAVYDVGMESTSVGIYHCSNLSEDVEAINLDNVKNKIYRMPLWSGTKGEEEFVIENEWICVSLLTPLIIPRY